MKRLFCSICLTLFVLLAGCTNPNEKANEIFTLASQEMERMKAETVSYSKALESYKSAEKNIELIQSKYPSSNIAVNLLSGQATVSGFKLSDLQKLKISLEVMANAESDPLLCALYAARAINLETDKAGSLAELADLYIKKEEKDKAVQLLAEAHDVAQAIDNHSSKAKYLAFIANEYANAGLKEKADLVSSTRGDNFGMLSADTYAHDWSRDLFENINDLAKQGSFADALDGASLLSKDARPIGLVLVAIGYTKAGQNEKATQIFSKAVEEAKAIDFVHLKIDAFIEMATELAMAGQSENAIYLMHQALEVAKVEEKLFRPLFLFKIAKGYARAGLRPSGEDTTLREIVQMIYPINLGPNKFWWERRT